MFKRTFITTLFIVSAFYTTWAQNPNPKKTATQKLAKLIEPWPEAAVLSKRRVEAERRALFQAREPLAFTLESEFSVVNKDRDRKSVKRYPAVLKIPASDGEVKSVSINVSARGHLRRKAVICSFIPLRLVFPKDGVKGTALEGPAGALKLVTHCQGSKEHEQFVLREYLAYQLSNILTPKSFRARLAKVTYVDSVSKKLLTTRYALLLEDDSDVARRMEGRVVALERTMFKELEPDTLAHMMVFQYMIGNTDFSIFALHNVILVQTPSKALHPVSYDFDLSGFVHPPYAVPAPHLGLKSVLDRAYRGPCLTEEQLASVFSTFRSKKAEMLDAANSIPDLDSAARSEAKRFLGEFFSTIDRPASVKRVFVNGCSRTTM